MVEFVASSELAILTPCTCVTTVAVLVLLLPEPATSNPILVLILIVVLVLLDVELAGTSPEVPDTITVVLLVSVVELPSDSNWFCRIPIAVLVLPIETLLIINGGV